jgi:hypothetical protein
MLEMDIGTIDYMYYKIYLKQLTKQGVDNMKAEQTEDALEDLM